VLLELKFLLFLTLLSIPALATSQSRSHGPAKGVNVIMPGATDKRSKIFVSEDGGEKVTSLGISPENGVFVFTPPRPCSSQTLFKSRPVNRNYRNSKLTRCSAKIVLMSPRNE
jgi:hypothetical protein